MPSKNFDHIDPVLLKFDTENPRLIEFGIKKQTSQEDIFKVLWESMDIKELIMSMISSGFFTNEPLIVERSGKIVIEGNRRLAAVLAIRQVKEYRELLGPLAARIEKYNKQNKTGFDEIPVVYQTREESWKYLGFKHVNGPARWTSYAKAKYVADVHRQYGIPLDEIADQIGDTHNTVKRLFQGLAVIEQAEKRKLFNRENTYNSRFAFSHLYTGLGKDGFQQYLGTTTDLTKKNPVPKKNEKNLRNLLLWLYGDRESDIKPKIKSQNPDLKALDEILASGNRKAMVVLADRQASLESAADLIRSGRDLFEESLSQGHANLQRALMHTSDMEPSQEDRVFYSDQLELIDKTLKKISRSLGLR